MQTTKKFIPKCFQRNKKALFMFKKAIRTKLSHQLNEENS
ncbi:MAG: hypothetical protein H6Q17_2518 [Bacteroidetes bacterium]|nr:hypothetical protein [Bacteroidota bacterium]